MKKLNLILIIAVTLAFFAGSAAAMSIGGDRGFIRVECDIDGAAVTLISISGTDIETRVVQNGYAEFVVYTTGTPAHAVRVEADGYSTATFDVSRTPSAGETVYVQAHLVQAPIIGGERGVIQVTSNVNGATVELISVNGDVAETGTIQNGQVEFAVYTTGVPITQVRVSASGYTTGNQPVQMPAMGATSTVDVPLTAVPTPTASPVGVFAGVFGLLGAAALLRRE